MRVFFVRRTLGHVHVAHDSVQLWEEWVRVRKKCANGEVLSVHLIHRVFGRPDSKKPPCRIVERRAPLPQSMSNAEWHMKSTCSVDFHTNWAFRCVDHEEAKPEH